MNKPITIANFVLDEKFIDGVIAFNKNFSPKRVRHIYIYVTESHKDNFNLIKCKSDIIQLSPNEVISYLYQNSVDAILLHSIYSMPLNVIALIPKDFCVIWSSWGFDIYSIMGYNLLISQDLFRPLTREYFHLPPYSDEGKEPDEAYKKAVQRVDFLSTVLPEEYELIPSSSFLNANKLHYTYISPKEIATYQNASVPSLIGNNILVGNSSAHTNNHLDIFQKLSELDLGTKLIYCPLSYAGCPQEYKEGVLEQGKKLFGNRFIPLLAFLDKENYFNLVSCCGYVFFGHIRQQALGNVREFLVRGCKVFLDKESPMYKHFKDRGINVLSIQDDVTEDQLSAPFDYVTIQANIERMKQYTSPERYYSEMSLIKESVYDYRYRFILQNSSSCFERFKTRLFGLFE